MSDLNINKIRADFPILQTQVHGKPLVYLDNAATTQKPQPVIDRITHFYTHEYANVHRGVHQLSQIASEAFEATRDIVKNFIHAKSRNEIIFTSGTTESINLVADSFGRSFIRENDEIIISAMEHHANIVPWQVLCQKTGAKLRIIPMDNQGVLKLDEYKKLLNSKTKLVSIVQISNVLGTVNPIKEIIEIAHAQNIPVLVDGAQAVAHQTVDVQELDCDFYVFSGHKLFGPTGTGILYGKQKWLEEMPPYQTGGNMIRTVSFEKTTYAELPEKFEAGTPNIAGIIGLGAAIQYLTQFNMQEIADYEYKLMAYAKNQLLKVPGVRLIGESKQQVGAISFVMDSAHPHDIGTILDQAGVAIRTGHHCAMPIMQFFDVPATARASFAFYNTVEEIDALIRALLDVHEMFGAS